MKQEPVGGMGGTDSSFRMTNPMTPTIPSPLMLGHEARIFLLSWLHTDVLCGRPITAETWRDAWGRAVDYQQVVNLRAELAGVRA